MSEQNNMNKGKVRIDFPPKWVTARRPMASRTPSPTARASLGLPSSAPFRAHQGRWQGPLRLQLHHVPEAVEQDRYRGRQGTGVFVNADRNVSLFKYDQDGQRHDESVEPQKLSDAVETARAEYREQHQSHDRSQEQETGLDELCEQKTAEASERDGGSQDRSAQNVQR